MQRIVLTLLFVFTIYIGNSQSVSTQIGSRAAGMAYASACLQDEWSLFNNVAGLAKVKQSIIATSHEARPALTGANRSALTAALAFKPGTVGLGVFHFGDDLYSENRLSLAFSNQLGLAALGMSVNYVQYNALGFGTHHILSISAGGIATLSKRLLLGAHIQNMSQASLSESDEALNPTLITLGLAFIPSDKVLLSAQLEKDLVHPSTFKTGLEYKASKKFTVRTGFSLYPNNLYTGIGFAQRRLLIDYAYQYAFAGLGSAHQASIGYKLKAK